MLNHTNEGQACIGVANGHSIRWVNQILLKNKKGFPGLGMGRIAKLTWKTQLKFGAGHGHSKRVTQWVSCMESARIIFGALQIPPAPLFQRGEQQPFQRGEQQSKEEGVGHSNLEGGFYIWRTSNRVRFKLMWKNKDIVRH